MDAGHEVLVIAPPPHYQRKISVREWWATRQRRANRRESIPDSGPSGEAIFRSGFFPEGPSLTQRVINQATVALGSVWAVLQKQGPLRGYKPDLIIGTVPALPTAAATYLVAKILRTRYIIDLRDAWPVLLEESDSWNKGVRKTSFRERGLKFGPLQMTSAATRFVMYWTLRRAAAITVTSSYLEAAMGRREAVQKNGIAPPMVTIRNVFPPETEFTNRLDAACPAGQLRVLYAGTLGRAQNLANTLAAVEIARDMGVEVSVRFVGAGAAKPALQAAASNSGLPVTFEPRHDADDLAEFYEWADTALVHLTDWQALDKAVPSKTYELMGAQLHITGVVGGEAADIIRVHNAGLVVEPENPEELARTWVKLANNRHLLNVDDEGARWVRNERDNVAPKLLQCILGQVI